MLTRLLLHFWPPVQRDVVQKVFMPSTSRLAAGITVSVWIAAIAPGATLRVASWNMANHPNDSTDTANLQTILSFAGTGHAVDVLAMAETDTLSAPSTAATASGVFGGTYASIMTPADGGGDRTGFVYNPARVSLIASTVVGTGSITHPSMRAQFRPLGTTGSDDFYMYAVHLQSGDTTRTPAVGGLNATRAVEMAMLLPPVGSPPPMPAAATALSAEALADLAARVDVASHAVSPTPPSAAVLRAPKNAC